MFSSSKRMDAWRASALLMLTLVACSTPPAQEAARPPTPAPASLPSPAVSGPKVAFLGDSISAGLHLPSDQAYPAVVQRALAARGKPFELLNAGLSGDTTAG